MSFISELKRRNVFRVGAAYIVGSWILVQVAETLFPLFGFDDTPARIVVILLAIGLIPTLVLSWVFELTPEGLIKDDGTEQPESPTADTIHKVDRIIILALAVALGYFALDKFLIDPARDETKVQTARQEGRVEALTAFHDKSIAVLPFADKSPERNQQYLSDGIAEELLNLLAKIPELKVISRSSSFSFKDQGEDAGQDKDYAEIAEKLNVAQILYGTVLEVNGNLRIFAKLIEGSTGEQRWSKKYDRKLDNIFAMQDEIARDVVDELKIELFGEAPKTLRTDPAAYSLFLQARHLRRQNTEDSLATAETMLLEVLKDNPDYLPALDDLVTVYINQAHAGYIDFDEGYRKATTKVLNGLIRNPDSGRLHAHLAWIRMFYEGNAIAAAEEFQTALTLIPTDIPVIVDAASFMFVLGRYDDAIKLGEYAIGRDPVYPVAFANLANTLTSAGRYDEAIATYNKVLNLSPGYVAINFYLGVALLQAGRYDDALLAMQKESIDGYRLTGLSLVYYKLGDKEQSDAALQSLIATQSPGTESNSSGDDPADKWTLYIAMTKAYRGETDDAFEWIEKASRDGHPDLAEINTNVLFKSLHGDSRWTDLMQALGKSPDQLDDIEFDVELPE